MVALGGVHGVSGFAHGSGNRERVRVRGLSHLQGGAGYDYGPSGSCMGREWVGLDAAQEWQ